MKQAKSTYQRYRKAPFLYSEQYRAWRRAVLDGDDEAIRKAAEAHARRFAPVFVRREAA